MGSLIFLVRDERADRVSFAVTLVSLFPVVTVWKSQPGHSLYWGKVQSTNAATNAGEVRSGRCCNITNTHKTHKRALAERGLRPFKCRAVVGRR